MKAVSSRAVSGEQWTDAALRRIKTAFWLLVIVAAFWVTAGLYVAALSGSPLTLTPPLQSYPVWRVLEVYDGDTATLELDLGLDVRVVKTVRLFGVDAPEIRPLKSRDAGIAARDWLRMQMLRCPDLRVVTGTEKGRPQIGKYGRLLVRLECEGKSLNDELVARGWAEPYDGGARD